MLPLTLNSFRLLDRDLQGLDLQSPNNDLEDHVSHQSRTLNLVASFKCNWNPEIHHTFQNTHFVFSQQLFMTILEILEISLYLSMSFFREYQERLKNISMMHYLKLDLKYRQGMQGFLQLETLGDQPDAEKASITSSSQ